MRVTRVDKGDEAKPSPYHESDVGEGAKVGSVVAELFRRGPVRNPADEELARLMF